jgi:4-hydroxy-3-methylbut-2-enyl diphosphate reductase
VTATANAGPLVCVALRFEARAVRAGWPGADLAVVGMRAGRLDRVAAHDGPVILLGFGGGLRPGQRPGDVVVATDVRSRDDRTHLPRAREAREALRRAGLAASSGILWCSNVIVRGKSRAELADLASAVDMESAALLAACGPDRLVVVRVLVDTPQRGLLRASIFSGRRAKRALRSVSAALAAHYPTITSGTVSVVARATSGHSTSGQG